MCGIVGIFGAEVDKYPRPYRRGIYLRASSNFVRRSATPWLSSQPSQAVCSRRYKEVALRSLEKVKYRGSSIFELKEFPHAVLGANRLPIQGRESGMQPLCNEDETIRACQNGEIFNYRELRAELELLGHTFKTDCDTEVLVHLYEEYGVEAIKKIDSEMFACIIYDLEKGNVLVGRDRLGVKPLYYGFHENGNIHFASEMKQLVQFGDIDQIYTFPKGNYYYNGVFTSYSELSIASTVYIEGTVYSEPLYIEQLTVALEDAVRKRVQTDLPIGVFLSGGVDSSLIMELATKYHDNVTAIILGVPGSSDYEFALRLCQQKNYRYHLVTPDKEYRKNPAEMIYYTESYEPLIINHAFANDMCSRAAAELGIKIVLLGEGADEIFAGYNEFAGMTEKYISTACTKLLTDLEFGHLKRVDRLAMKYTVETRCPFLDDKVVQIGLGIPGAYKLKKINKKIITKYILRKVADQFLPRFIAWRYKVPFANGAGMNVGVNYKKGDGEISAYIDSLGKFMHLLGREQAQKYTLHTNTEAHNFLYFEKYGYTKLMDASQRILVKDTLKDLERIYAVLEYMKQSKYRKHMPFLEKTLYETIERSFTHGRPLSFFLFRGASDKEKVDEHDMKCITYMSSFFEGLGKVFGGKTQVTRLLADEHGLNNGYNPDKFRAYFAELHPLLTEKGRDILYLYELYRRYNFERKREIQKYLMQQPEGRWDKVVFKSTLESNASKHYIAGNQAEGAQLYFAMRTAEKCILEDCFRGSIFITFGSNEFQCLYPELPTLYMYATKKGRSDLPWFL